MTQKFKIGETVFWASQSNGSLKVKTGKIVHILKRDMGNWKSNPCHIADRLFPNHKRMFDGFQIPGGAEIGCLVEVLPEGKGKPRLYMPRPNQLRSL